MIGSFRATACACIVVLVGLAPALASDKPFSSFEGSWSGSGAVRTADGASERLRCRAAYRVSGDGAQMRQDLVCASDSYKFEISSDVTSTGGVLGGTWSERTRGVSGHVAGRTGSRRIDASVDGLGFTATMVIVADRRTQSIDIRPTGTDVTGVTLNMSRR
ncbi:hypothetical protein [Beijerinckia sp. L45]|uniref:hypothetical protein n=1 Tax=Beijerinckia sp. L45 TaxID=1641855 RepID=UPI00131C4949|nr:hypothetical protein [Beijerinckia sp. L45]